MKNSATCGKVQDSRNRGKAEKRRKKSAFSYFLQKNLDLAVLARCTGYTCCGQETQKCVNRFADALPKRQES